MTVERVVVLGAVVGLLVIAWAVLGVAVLRRRGGASFHVDRRLVVLAAATSLQVVACLATYVLTDRWIFVFFVWNLFLAVLPLVASVVVEAVGPARAWVGWVGVVVWLPLFPNTVYVATDVVHLRPVRFSSTSGQWPFRHYSGDPTAWVQLVVMMGLVVLTLWLGMWSLSQVHAFLAARWGRAWGLTAVGVISVACGYGVYLGRFVRLNSWQVLRPDTLARTLVAATNRFMLLFTVVFAVYVLVAYALFWAFADRSPVRFRAPRGIGALADPGRATVTRSADPGPDVDERSPEHRPDERDPTV